MSPGAWRAPRLARVHSIAGLRALARRRVPRAVFDYVDGAAEQETSLARARQAFADVEFRPRVLRDVSTVDASTTILGRRAELPLVFAPTGFTRMMHHEGEPAVARAAARLGVPYALSTMGTTSPERLAAVAPDTWRWFQLYVWRDRAAVKDLLDRAAASGFATLVLTVDTPVPGARLRDLDNGLTIPPALTLRTVLDAALHPAWWGRLLTGEPLSFASFASWDGTLAELVGTLFDPSLSFEDLARLRAEWSGSLVVKGVQTAEDARAVVDLGADAVVVSNHGGRQLDRAPTPLEELGDVAAAVGDRAEVYLDGGILSGADVVAAVGLGARACLVGRAYLYGLMAGGQRGVERAGEILRTDVVRTMQLLGATSMGELGGGRVRLRGAPARVPSVAPDPKPGPSPPEPAARLAGLPAYVAGRSATELCAERGVADVLELAANENPLGPPEAAVRAVREAAAQAHRYPDGSTRSLRGVLARSFDVGEDAVLVAGGAEHVLGLLAQALLAPGLAAVMPRPSFPVYRSATIAAGGEAREVDLPGWEYDIEAVVDRLDERTRLVFVASPNNPTGTYPAERDLERLLAALGEGALRVLDEAYREYADAATVPDGPALLGRDPRVAVVRTLSKAYGLAGLRVGYLLARPEIVDLVARVRPAFAVNGLAERAGAAALADAEHLRRTTSVNREGRAQLAAGLAARGLGVTPSQANFLWVDTRRDDDAVWDGLLDHGVVVRSGRLWGHLGHVRVTVGTEAQNDRLLSALDAVLGSPLGALDGPSTAETEP